MKSDNKKSLSPRQRRSLLREREEEIIAQEKGLEKSIIKLKATQMLVDHELAIAKDTRIDSEKIRSELEITKEAMHNNIRTVNQYHPMLNNTQPININITQPDLITQFVSVQFDTPAYYPNIDSGPMKMGYALTNRKNEIKSYAYCMNIKALISNFRGIMNEQMVDDISRIIASEIIYSTSMEIDKIIDEDFNV